MSLSSEPGLLLWLILVTWPISAKGRSLKKGDKDSDFLSAKSTTGLSRSDANEGNFHHGLFDPLRATAHWASETGTMEQQHTQRRKWTAPSKKGELPVGKHQLLGDFFSPPLFLKGILSFWCAFLCYLIQRTALLWWNSLAVHLFKSRVNRMFSKSQRYHIRVFFRLSWPQLLKTY